MSTNLLAMKAMTWFSKQQSMSTKIKWNVNGYSICEIIDISDIEMIDVG